MKRIFGVLLVAFMIFHSVSAQDLILRTTDERSSSVELVNHTSETDMQMIERPGLLPSTGNQTVLLKDRTYEFSVNFKNAREVFQSGEDVPKPTLDRPITDSWNDLQPGYACKAILNKPYYFQQLKFGEEFTLDVTFINTGTEPWDFNMDVMLFSGDNLEKSPKDVYDLTKDYEKKFIVYPGQSIRWTLPMRAPMERYHEDNKYYSAYTLVKNWNLYGMDELHSDSWGNDHMVEVWEDGKAHSEYQPHYRPDEGAMFCPIYFYIYVI